LKEKQSKKAKLSHFEKKDLSDLMVQHEVKTKKDIINKLTTEYGVAEKQLKSKTNDELMFLLQEQVNR
jgi:hypothetical protein